MIIDKYIYFINISYSQHLVRIWTSQNSNFINYRLLNITSTICHVINYENLREILFSCLYYNQYDIQ
jgi:hypothetical protein